MVVSMEYLSTVTQIIVVLLLALVIETELASRQRGLRRVEAVTRLLTAVLLVVAGAITLMALANPAQHPLAYRLAMPATTIALASAAVLVLSAGLVRSLPDLPRPQVVDWTGAIVPTVGVAMMVVLVITQMVDPQPLPAPFDFSVPVSHVPAATLDLASLHLEARAA